MQSFNFLTSRKSADSSGQCVMLNVAKRCHLAELRMLMRWLVVVSIVFLMLPSLLLLSCKSHEKIQETAISLSSFAHSSHYLDIYDTVWYPCSWFTSPSDSSPSFSDGADRRKSHSKSVPIVRHMVARGTDTAAAVAAGSGRTKTTKQKVHTSNKNRYIVSVFFLVILVSTLLWLKMSKVK